MKNYIFNHSQNLKTCLLDICYFYPLFIEIIEAYKILVVNPKVGYSHVNFLSQIADTLVDAGHNVTVLTIGVDPTVNHPGSYKAKIIYYPATKKIENYFINSFTPDFYWDIKSSGNDQLKVLEKLMASYYDTSVNIFNDDDLAEILRREKYDVGICEALSSFFPGMLKAWGVGSIVSVTSMSLFDQAYQNFGLSFPASYMPASMSQFTDKMTYVERCQNLFLFFLGKYFFYVNNNKMSLQEEFDKKYGKGFFDSLTIVGDSSFYIVNSNPFIDIPGPMTAKMIEVSGIGIKDIEPLDKFWDEILSLRSKTILISFGTMAKSSYMPKNLKNGLLETIKRMKDITFIWKYESPEDGTGEGIENLILSKWFPQSDLLNDKRLTLFITHGGAGSVTEAFFRGVPVVAIPILNDQYKNVKLFERHGTGLLMDKNDLSNYSILEKKIKEVIGNKEYKEKAEVMAKMLKKRPIQPKELLIKHIEFAAEFGSLEVLDLASRNMSFIEYYNLDIIVPFLVILSSVISVLFYVLYKFIRSIFYSKVKND